MEDSWQMVSDDWEWWLRASHHPYSRRDGKKWAIHARGVADLGLLYSGKNSRIFVSLLPMEQEYHGAEWKIGTENREGS
jgi:hypothetical protein